MQQSLSAEERKQKEEKQFYTELLRKEKSKKTHGQSRMLRDLPASLLKTTEEEDSAERRAAKAAAEARKRAKQRGKVQAFVQTPYNYTSTGAPLYRQSSEIFYVCIL